ncbi:MAG: hypothetical protein U0840_27845 [Gemmataceae bacterium]
MHLAMALYLQYHNAERLGWLPLDEAPFRRTHPAIFTRRSLVTQAMGGQVLVIVSLGRPRRYFLWESFQVTSVSPLAGGYFAWGPGWQLAPPQLLEGTAFEEFRRACANFVGFRSIQRLDYAASLVALAERFRERPLSASVEEFCTQLIEWLPNQGDAYFARAQVRLGLGRTIEARNDLERARHLGSDLAPRLSPPSHLASLPG